MTAALRADAEAIALAAVRAVLPDTAVLRALEGRRFPGRVFVVAAGKAAWRMAAAAAEALGERLTRGAVVTKTGHVRGPIPRMDCYEGGHPVPDEGGVAGTRAALRLVSGLQPSDTVLFLLSGGGSALFEDPLIPLEELRDVTDQLLASGCGIREANTVRKRLSGVKGGRFALRCAPARVIALILSDVLGDPPDMIASGPVSPDTSTCADAEAVVRRWGLRLSPAALSCLRRETPKALPGAETRIIGGVRQLCAAAAEAAESLGYAPLFLTDRLECEAREAGLLIGAVAAAHAGGGRQAWIMGGETVVRLGAEHGLGGRNQELALAAALPLDGVSGAAVISVGSDGTDGPTDAAGGYADGETCRRLAEKGVSLREALAAHDAYHALRAAGGLIVTGPTGTNVNDLTVALVRGRAEREA